MGTFIYAAAETASDGISTRFALVVLASVVAGLVGARLGYLYTTGRQQRRLAAAAMAGAGAFVAAFTFLNPLVADGGTAPAATVSPPGS